MTKPRFIVDIDRLVLDAHMAAVEGGWYTDLETGAPKERNIGEMLMLIVSEIAEAMEGHRKSLPSDKLEGFTAMEEELADAIIRIFDLAGYCGARLGSAYVAKRSYNEQRADHKIENRRKDDGKKY